MNPLLELHRHDQSLWLDNLTRAKITGGELASRVAEQGLRGVTSNPTIFHKAISGSNDYDGQIARGFAEGLSVREVYEGIVTSDVRDACDVLRPVYDESGGAEGYVSLEVSPHLARDPEGTIEEARRLFALVGKPNLFIKIPGTREGLTAIEQCLFEGININITLLFSVERYEEVAQTHLNALERRLTAGEPIDRVASVASFFLSRIDVLVDQRLQQMIDSGSWPGCPTQPADLLGKAAVANARIAYQSLKRLLAGEAWQHLSERGALPQRLLWASTSTKNPHYSDVMYVEPLIGPVTVNTMPDETITAFADHGQVADTVEKEVDAARKVMEDLACLGIDFRQVTDQLEVEGIEKFIQPFDALADLLQRKHI